MAFEFYGNHWSTTCQFCQRGFPHPQRGGYALCPQCSESGANWLFDVECPNCEDGGMVAQDIHGVFCAISGCGWKVENEEIEELIIDQLDMEK